MTPVDRAKLEREILAEIAKYEALLTRIPPNPTNPDDKLAARHFSEIIQERRELLKRLALLLPRSEGSRDPEG